MRRNIDEQFSTVNKIIAFIFEFLHIGIMKPARELVVSLVAFALALACVLVWLVYD